MKKETIERIRKFTEDRDWDQFHSPANLAKSISIEANELLECFQWSDTDYDINDVKEELADVLVYCRNMLDKLGLDEDEIINFKMSKNEEKYPVSKSKGKADKYKQTIMDKKIEQIKQMLNLIMDSSHPMPDYVFRYYADFKKKPEEKIFYNLIADTFLTLFSYCKLMFENAWSQAFTVLRMGLEQVAAVFLLTNTPGTLQKYIDLHRLMVQFINIKSEDDKKEFLRANGIPKNRINDFFDYSWISGFTSDGKYGRNQLIKLAKLEEFLVDIEQSLNAFSHGSMSVFQMSGDNWNVMKKYGKRASLTCCKLYDFLCCSYHKLIGDEEFTKLPLDRYFKSFKLIYLNLFVSEGWI